MEYTRDHVSACLGKTIREFRINRKKSIEALANELNIDYSQISRIERGKINTSFYQLYRIVHALNCNLDEFNRRLQEHLKNSNQ